VFFFFFFTISKVVFARIARVHISLRKTIDLDDISAPSVYKPFTSGRRFISGNNPGPRVFAIRRAINTDRLRRGIYIILLLCVLYTFEIRNVRAARPSSAGTSFSNAFCAQYIRGNLWSLIMLYVHKLYAYLISMCDIEYTWHTFIMYIDVCVCVCVCVRLCKCVCLCVCVCVDVHDKSILISQALKSTAPSLFGFWSGLILLIYYIILC